MPNYIRTKIPGAAVYFTVCLADRRSSLLVDHIEILREAVAFTLRRRPFEIAAWVVLPNHMHAVWSLPESDSNFSQRWGMIKARFSKHVRMFGHGPQIDQIAANGGVNPALRKSEVGIWQRRFWEHHIRCAEEFSATVRYCHANPVKHGYVERPQDWPFSSVHRDIRAGRWAA